MRLKSSLLIVILVGVFVAASNKPEPYDFRKSPAYAALSNEDRQKLDQVDKDFTLLWGALDRYADEHGDATPESLEKLVPIFLKEIPRDPFSPQEKNSQLYTYTRGATPNRAWVISSIGLPTFPYLAEQGNIGLYRAKGTWVSGWNPVVNPNTQPTTSQ
jgi:hypothetical protein